MNNFLTKLAAVIGSGVIIVLLMLISPALVLWGINSLAEAGGSSFYAEHNLFNYWVAFILVLVFRGWQVMGEHKPSLNGLDNTAAAECVVEFADLKGRLENLEIAVAKLITLLGLVEEK